MASSKAELVLGSAGIETTIDGDSAQVPASASRLLAAVVREAVTNILRHSDARTVSITFDGTGQPCPTLVIMNDGAGRQKGGTAADGPSSGTVNRVQLRVVVSHGVCAVPPSDPPLVSLGG